MSNRDMTSAVETALQGSNLTLVLIGRLDFDGDPIKSWTGPGTFAPSGSGDAALDGQTFDPLAPFISITEISEDQSIGGPTTLQLAGHDLDEEALIQAVKNKNAWRGKPAYLWIGILNADEYTVLADPVRIKTGVMTNIRTNRGEDGASVSVTIDRDLGNAKAAPFRWVDHPRFYSADTFSSFVVKLANKPKGLGRGGVPEIAPGFGRPLSPRRSLF